MFESVFTLRQETPIIHFLHDQPGATLRATELKPKLDRFILNDFQTFFPEKAELHSSAISALRSVVEEQTPSLYKVFVSQTGEAAEPQFFYCESYTKRDERGTLPNQLKRTLNLPNLAVLSPSPFFANNDKRSNNDLDALRFAVKWPGDIQVTIKTWDSDINSLIKAALPLLLCCENFGMRQSKGFGGFTLKNMPQNTFEETVKAAFVFSAYKNSSANYEVLFKTIDDTYKSLRSKPPSDSHLRDYFAEKNVEWEKSTITQKIVKRNRDFTPDDEVRFVRALLGLPGLHDYPQVKPEKPKVLIKDDSNLKEKADRFGSPILFKSFGQKLYLLARPVPHEMLNRPFRFYIGNNPDTERAETIHTPLEFDIKDFLTEKLQDWNEL